MHTSYTVGITTGEYKALQYVMVDQKEWITNAITHRALVATKDFEIRHQCGTSVGGDGFGVGNNFGGVCIYTVVEIFKQN